MKIKSILALLCASIAFFAHAQQNQHIDMNTGQHWSRLHDISGISDNGKYIYFFQTGPDGLTIRSTANGWHKSISCPATEQIKFTADSRFIFLQKQDTLFMLPLGSGRLQIVSTGVSSFKLSTGNKTQWIAYQLKGKNDSLLVKNLSTGVQGLFAHAQDYRFDKRGTFLFINSSTSLSRIELKIRHEQLLVKGDSISNPVFDKELRQLAFFRRHHGEGQIRYFGPGLDSPRVLADDQVVSPFKEASGLSPDGIRFSNDGQTLFYQLKLPERDWKRKPGISLQMWSYQDEIVLNHEPIQFTNNLWLSQGISDQQPVVLFKNLIFLGAGTKDFGIVRNNIYSEDELWNAKAWVYSLVNIHSGEKKLISNAAYPGIGMPVISPDERYVVWFDNSDHNYHSYSIIDHVFTTISNGVAGLLYEKDNDIPSRRIAYGLAGWQKDGSLLVYDQYDIWKLDPSGKKGAICLTNGYGRNHHIMLRRVAEDHSKLASETISDQKLLLTGFHTDTKQNGFFDWSPENGRLKAGAQGNYLYTFEYLVPNFIDPLCKNVPRKAKNAPVLLVTRMSATESPNLFVTSDFTHFKSMSDIHPEKAHTWLTAELVRWKLPDGGSAEGILYKPENFDPLKKYPVIFHYYEKFSDLLNWFPGNGINELTSDVGPGDGVLSIANYTSKGYLVFVPNIYYKKEHIAESVTGSIRSAYDELARRSYVDTKHLGLQGHSFGGFETVTLISRLNLFSAAQASDGLYNSTSYYNHVFPGGGSYRSRYFDMDQGNLGCSPWECPEIYIENSPIFRVQYIQTPLLLLHNSGDTNVPVTEAIALFVSMRRLNKPVWFFDYGPGEGHELGGYDSIDFSLRQEAFFDHYLKGLPQPDWMSAPDYNVTQLLGSDSK